MTPLVLLPGTMRDARLRPPQTEALAATHAHHLAPIAGQSTTQAPAAEAPAR